METFKEEIMRVYPSHSIWYKIKKFIITHFFPTRCYECSCTDCQMGEDGREYWYCPHLKNDICTICCVYDSLGEDYPECISCEHDKDRALFDDGNVYSLNDLWEPKEE